MAGNRGLFSDTAPAAPPYSKGPYTWDQNVTIDANLTVNGTFTFGDAATDDLTVNGDLIIADDRFLHFGTDEDVSIEYDEDGDNVLKITGADWHYGVDGTGMDVKFFGATAGSSLLWDTSADSLILEQGVLIAEKDNATTFRVKGASNANSASAGADIQSYTGMFTNDNYNNAASGGTKKNRLTFGANLDMDLVLQGPHQLRLVAADNNVTGGAADAATTNGVGQITMISRSDVIISPWAAAEALGDSYLIVSAITETVADVGGGGWQGDDIAVKVNTGNLYLQYDVTDGAVIVNSLTDGERDALTAVKGMIIYNETQDEYQIYDGAWKQISVAAAS